MPWRGLASSRHSPLSNNFVGDMSGAAFNATTPLPRYCCTCGYNLQGLDPTSACPECGSTRSSDELPLLRGGRIGLSIFGLFYAAIALYTPCTLVLLGSSWRFYFWDRWFPGINPKRFHHRLEDEALVMWVVLVVGAMTFATTLASLRTNLTRICKVLGGVAATFAFAATCVIVVLILTNPIHVYKFETEVGWLSVLMMAPAAFTAMGVITSGSYEALARPRHASFVALLVLCGVSAWYLLFAVGSTLHWYSEIPFPAGTFDAILALITAFLLITGPLVVFDLVRTFYSLCRWEA